MVQKAIGPNFPNELAAAGLLGLQFSWGADGVIEFGPEVTDAQKTAVNAVYAAHDPAKADPNAELAQRLAAGIVITSTATPALNGTYSINEESQRFISGTAAGIAARNRLPGGQATFAYGDAAGQTHAFSQQDFLNFADAVEDYVYLLYATAQQLLAGQSAPWPSNAVTIP
jgi:hypothetical protein